MASEKVRLDEPILGTRVVAALIDIALLSLFGALVSAAAGGAEASESRGATTYTFMLEGPVFLLWLAGSLAYFTLSEAATSQTVGKLAMGLTVTRTDGRRPTLVQILARNVVRIIDALPMLYVVGISVALADRKGRRLGDLVARTTVCRLGDR